MRIRPICIPQIEPIRSRAFVGSQPFVAGWGRLQEGGKTSNILQELQLPVLANADCEDRYQKQGKLKSENQFGDAVICAGVLTGGQDSCQGDSGSHFNIYYYKYFRIISAKYLVFYLIPTQVVH